MNEKASTYCTDEKRNVERIVLILENSEVLEFKPDNIHYMGINDIRCNKTFRSFGNGRHSIMSSFTTHNLKIVFSEISTAIKEKLQALPNVAQLHIYYSSGRHHWYYVSWQSCPENECANRYQSFYPDLYGNYVLTVKTPVRSSLKQAC